jgi:hypothetical protein
MPSALTTVNKGLNASIVTTSRRPRNKCKNPPCARSNIRTNRAVHQRNALALSLSTVRGLRVDAACSPGPAHFFVRPAGQASQTTQRSSRRKHSKIHEIAESRWRTASQTRRRPYARCACRRAACVHRSSAYFAGPALSSASAGLPFCRGPSSRGGSAVQAAACAASDSRR